MRLVHYTARATNPNTGGIVEPGEEILIDDAIPLGDHMVDVATGIAGTPKADPSADDAPRFGSEADAQAFIADLVAKAKEALAAKDAEIAELKAKLEPAPAPAEPAT